MLLHNLVEIQAIWGKGEDTVYRAVRRGDLRAYGRPGRQKYYSHNELVEAFGEPATRTTPPALKRRDNGDATKGGQLSFDEIEPAAAAA